MRAELKRTTGAAPDSVEVGAPSGGWARVSGWRALAETRTSRLVIGVGAVIVAGLLVTTVLALLGTRSGEIAHAKSEFSNLSLVLAEQTSSALQPADSFLRDAVRGLRHQLAHPHADDETDLHEQLKGHEASLAHVLSLFVIGPDGRPTHSSRSFPPPNINSSDRSYFKAHLGTEDRGLVISEPRRNRAEPTKWTFFLSRALRAEHGGIERVVVGSVDLDYFETLYRDIEIPGGGRILLLRQDGTILAGHPKTDEAIGRTLANAPGFGQSRAKLIAGVLDSGRAQAGIATLDGEEWITSTYPVGHYPLVVSVSVPVGAALGDWRDQATVIGLVALGGIGVFAFMLYLLYRQSILGEQREGALRQSEERFDLAARGTADGIWDWNVVTGEDYFSDRWLELVGYEPGELPFERATFEQLLHPDDKDEMLEAVRRHLEERAPYDIEYRLRHKSGEYRWFRARGQAIWDADGTPLRVAGSITDINDRKRAEAALRESEERLSAIIDNLPGGVYTRIVDADGNFSYPYISPGFQSIFGIDPETAMADPQLMFDAVHPDDRDRVREARIESAKALDTYDCEQRLVGASGGVKWCRTIARPRPLDGGGGVWVGIAIDITEQKQAEAAQRATSETLDAIIAASPVATILVDLDGHVQKWNPAAKFMFGWDEAEVIGKVLPPVPEKASEEFARHLELVGTGQMIGGKELSRTRKDGTTVDVELWTAPFRDIDGEIAGAVILYQNVTERTQAEQALRESEARLDAFFRAAPAGLAMLDDQFRYTKINESLAAMNGVSMEESIGKRLRDFSPDIAANSEARYREILETGESVKEIEITAPSPAKPDEIRHWLVNNFAIPDAGGKPVGIGAVVTDITERKRAEAALRESEEKLNAFFNNAPVGLAMYDRDIRYTKINRQLAWQSGLSIDEHVGKSLREIKPDVAQLLEQTYRRVFETEQALNIDVEGELPGQPGRKHWWWGSAFPATWDEDGPSTIGVVALDVTEQKRAEAAFRESEDRLTAYFDASPTGLAIFDDQLRYIKINETLARFNKLTPDQHIGKLMREIVSNLARQMEPVLRQVLDTGEPVLNMELAVEAPGDPGHWRHRLLNNFPIPGADGKPVAVGVVVSDITERKRAEAEIQELNERLERRVEERTGELRQVQQELVKKERLATLGQLAATVSHELRNPLGTIQTSVAVIDSKVRDKVAGVDRALDRVFRNVDRCDRIIQEMLDFTRVQQVALEPVNIDTWLAGVMDDLGAPDGVETRRQFGAGAARAAIDGERLRRAVINVHDNACQALTGAAADMAATGERVLCVTTTASSGRLEMSFSDTGPGMPADVLDNAFEPLFSTKAFGVGLGLPTVKQIMEMHSGGIEIESVEGHGTRVVLWLPTETAEDKGTTG